MSAPPGYNPDESLLDGGTTELVGVMGGGGQDGGQPALDATLASALAPAPPSFTDSLVRTARIQAAKTAAEQMTKASGASTEIISTAGRLAAEIESKKAQLPPSKLSVAAAGTVEGSNESDQPVGRIKEAENAARQLVIDNGGSYKDAEDAARLAIQIQSGKESKISQENNTADTTPAYTDVENSKEPIKPIIPIKRNLRINPMKKHIEKLQSKDIPIEYYALEEINNTFKKLMAEKMALLNVGSELRLGVRQQMDTYEQILIKSWQKRQPWNRQQAVYLPRTDSFKNIRGNEIIRTLSRLTYVLPIRTKSLIVIPPINGDPTKFMKCLETLNSNGVLDGLKLQKDFVLVCSSPFYGPVGEDTQHAKNFYLLTVVMDLKITNPEHFFVLSESTANNYGTGKLFHAARALPEEGNILTMLEPSYIVYPYKRDKLEGILVSSSLPGETNLPETRDKTGGLGKLYNFFKLGKATSLIYRPKLDTDAAANLFTIRFADIDHEIPSEGKDDCILANYMLSETYERYHPNLQMNSNMPNALVIFRLQNGDIPLCKSKEIAEIAEPQGPDKFYGSPAAQTGGDPSSLFKGASDISNIKTYPAEVSGKIYRIRIPGPFNTTDLSGDPVVENWKMGIYTNDEAELLNSMNLRPYMMSEIFPDTVGDEQGASWKEAIKNFFTNMVLSKCFTDESLMTKRECMTSREFMNSVFNYFTEKELRNDLLEEYETATANEAKARFQRGQEELKGAERVKSNEEPDNDEAEEITVKAFNNFKHQWGKLHIKVMPVTNKSFLEVIQVNKETGDQKYIVVSVPYHNDKESAQIAIEAKINNLKEKYPGFLFIY